MLNTISTMIAELKHDETTFSEEFMKYVVELQDESLEREISYMLHNHIWDVTLVDRAIINSLESLVKIYECS